MIASKLESQIGSAYMFKNAHENSTDTKLIIKTMPWLKKLQIPNIIQNLKDYNITKSRQLIQCCVAAVSISHQLIPKLNLPDKQACKAKMHISVDGPYTNHTQSYVKGQFILNLTFNVSIFIRSLASIFLKHTFKHKFTYTSAKLQV